MTERPIVVLLIILLPTLVLQVCGIPYAPELGILITSAILWIGEFLPAGITGLLIPVMIVVQGLAGPVEAFSHFGNQIVFLVIGSLLLVRAVQEHGVDGYLASLVLRFGARGNLDALAWALSACTCFVGMWMSNTACVLVFLPIVLGALDALIPNFKDASLRKACQSRLLLTVALMPSLGGMLTPMGSLPNAVAVGFMAEANLPVPLFAEWILMALPVSVCLALLVGLILQLRYPLGRVDPGLFASYRNVSAVSISADGRRVVGVVGLVIVLLVLPSILTSMQPAWRVFSDRLPMGVCSCLGAILLFIVPRKTADERGASLLNVQAIREIDLNPVFLLTGSLTLGKLLIDSGLAQALALQLVATTTWWAGALVVSGVLATILLSEVGSNTAAASIMIPVVYSALSTLGPSTVSTSSAHFIVGIALASGLGSMLPASTPPNMLVYATGRVPLREMMKTGLVLDALGLLVVSSWIFISA